MQLSPEWMDAACLKGDWDVTLSFDGDQNLEGILVYHKRKYRGFNLLLMPPQTFYSGIHIVDKAKAKRHTHISHQVKVVESLLKQTPTFDLFYLQLSPQFNNALSFIWEGYKLSTRYTYVVDTLNKQEEELWSELKTKVRNKIRKAIDITRIETIDFDTFWKNCQKSFQDKSQSAPFNYDVLKNVYDTFYKRKQCIINACVSKEDGSILAANFLTSDKTHTYYIAGYQSQYLKESGALSYLLWHNLSKCQTRYFDFEGSMIKNVEYFFRAFGGALTPHYKVWKINHPILQFILKFKKLDFLEW